ncbi:SDR family oxidoreductase [Aureimonas flava]|uniref:SDR family oxidoreductase n=1 Tax=Aureimonas flava TaxID=2320271 RepID=A0A3A1WPW4_9HYPH|nr:SDR family oxidoreductase [Aureimonas flava]RIX98511.1 SDR family oxidoreductase [Aureimonas flava]
MSGLAGQRVVITAGAGGIGLATARLLHDQGCRLAVCDVSEEALARVASELPGTVVARADVSDEGDVGRFFEVALGGLGGLDALVNNAGIAGPTGGVEDIAVADWRRCLDIGLTGQFLCARLAVPQLKAAGGGSMVNMSSSAGRHGYAFRTPYAAAKWGVIGFTQSLAKELGPHNIRVNAILPGIVAGPRMEGVIRDRAAQTGVSYEDMEARYLATTSLRRMVTAQDVAASVAFLLSDAARNLSALSFNVDGNVETL